VASLPENRGKSEAVGLGFLAAIDRGAGVVGYWDADLAAPLKEIALMEEVLAREVATEIIIGIRLPLLGRRIRRTAVRGTVGRFSALLTHALIQLRTRDTQCGAKLFRVTQELRKALSTPFQSRWLFDVELLMRLRHVQSQFEEVAYEFPLECWAEQPGAHVKATSYLGALRELVLNTGKEVARRVQMPARRRRFH